MGGAQTAISATWRGMTKRTIETIAITSRPKADTAQMNVVKMHARALTTNIETVPNKSREELKDPFDNVANSFQKNNRIEVASMVGVIMQIG